MKYLIVSDIHGSLPALEQVLAFYREQQCGMLCILGDILNYGPGTGYLKDLTRKGSQNVSMRWPVRLSPSVETVIRRWTRCCWTFPSCPITPCWWIMENVSFSPTDISTMRTDCRREGSIVFFYGHTHRWKLERTEHTAVCNTGSITFPKDGNMPTFAIYCDGTVSVHRLDGSRLKELSL